MLDTNILKVSLRTSKKIRTTPLHRWDTGMKLEFEGIDIPLNTTCQFETGNGEAILQLVDSTTKRVDIPNSLLNDNCWQDIRAHLYIATESYGMTVYDIIIPVIQREQPADHISPDNTQTIEEWISEQVELVDDDRQAVEAMSATASVENDGGDPEVDVTKTVTDHVNLDFAFKNVIGRKGDPGADGKDGKDGADGVTPSFSIGTVSSVDPMYPPYVTITGTDANPVLNFGLPKGNSGMGVELRNVNVLTDSGATRGTVTAVSAVTDKTTYDIDLYNIQGAQGADGKAGDSFNDANVYTDAGATRVELTVVAVGKDGSKTYDVDFYNIGGGSDLPEIDIGDAGKVVAVNNSEDGYELVPQSGGLPPVTYVDAGKVLTVTMLGGWDVENVPTELPAVSVADEGKVLGVNNLGAWAVSDPPASGAIVHKGSGAPTSMLLAKEGDFYRDTVTNRLYVCTSYTNPLNITDLAGLTIVMNLTGSVLPGGIQDFSYDPGSSNWTSQVGKYDNGLFTWWGDKIRQIGASSGDLYFGDQYNPERKFFVPNGQTENIKIEFAAYPGKNLAFDFKSTFHCTNSEFIAWIIANAADISGVGATWAEVVAIPAAPPNSNGTYKLRCTVTGGVPSYSWVSDT